MLEESLVQQAEHDVWRELKISTDGNPVCQSWGYGSEGKKWHCKREGREKRINTKKRGNVTDRTAAGKRPEVAFGGTNLKSHQHWEQSHGGSRVPREIETVTLIAKVSCIVYQA